MHILWTPPFSVVLAPVDPRDKSIQPKIRGVDGTVSCEEKQIVEEASKNASTEGSKHRDLETQSVADLRRRVRKPHPEVVIAGSPHFGAVADHVRD